MTERIILAGASGLIGQELRSRLRDRNSEVLQLVRRPPQHPQEAFWNPDEGIIDHKLLENATALISLGGASVGKLPWTSSYQRELRSSRIRSTRTLAEAIIQLGDAAPQAWLSASAVGYYGSRPGEVLTESSAPGDTFLARLCVQWEAEALRAAAHTRLVLLRTAPIIHPQGVLKPMMLLTRLGGGGPLGTGKQHWPWISLTDEVRAILFALDHPISGPVNLTGPEIVSQNTIGRALAKRMKRPYLVPAPEPALRTLLGEDATRSLLTSDAMVEPRVLLEHGFTFQHTTPEQAIREALA